MRSSALQALVDEMTVDEKIDQLLQLDGTFFSDQAERKLVRWKILV